MGINVRFHYSIPYDELLHLTAELDYSIEQGQEVKKYIAKLEIFWKKEGKSLLKAIEHSAGLSFLEDIDIYVVSDLIFEAISHPFTIRIEPRFSRLKGILVHELLHVLFSQHSSKIIPFLNKLEGDHDYKIHFPVLLCERLALEKLHQNYRREKRVEDLDYVWQDVMKVYADFKKSRKGIVPFLQKYVAH